MVTRSSIWDPFFSQTDSLHRRKGLTRGEQQLFRRRSLISFDCFEFSALTLGPLLALCCAYLAFG